MNTNKLNFNYLPLTFISSENEIRNHIVNTIIFRYIQDTYKDVRKLGELLVKSQYGFTASAQESGNVRLLRISDIKNNKVNWDTVPYCDCDNVNYLLKKEDILVARTGGTTGKSFYIDEISEDTVFASYLIRLTASNDINPKFIMLFFNNYLYWNQISTMKSGSAQPNVNAEKLKTLLIPYCSLELQEKFIEISENINTDIEELKPLVNKIENALSQYSLIKEQNNIIDDNLKLIEKLRQLILQEAVEGKLVPQDPNDEPASELLKKIQIEKTRLIKNKQLKEGKLTINSKTISFGLQIPNKWNWAKGNNIFFVTKLAGFEYTEHIKLEDYGEIPVIRAQNVRPMRLELENLKYIDRKTSEFLSRCALTKKALLVTFIGAGIGDVALFDKTERWHLAPNVAKMELIENCENLIDLKFINYFLISNQGRKEIFKHLKSTAQPSISMETIRDIDYPIPPLPEQKRIVQKIDDLMKFCDEIEEGVKQSKDTIEKLLESLLHELFNK